MRDEHLDLELGEGGAYELDEDEYDARLEALNARESELEAEKGRLREALGFGAE